MDFRTPRPLALALASVIVVATGCASSPLHEAARAGRWEALRTELENENARERLDADEIRALATTVLAREIDATSDEEAKLAIERIRPCATWMAAPLERRAKAGGNAAAAAKLALYEAALAGRGLVAEHEEDADPVFRAVGTRALVRAEDSALRRARMVDADERVRIQALAAAVHARDPNDADVLLETARLDPSPTARTMAIRAAGALGGAEIASRLRDLWSSVDEAGRRAIVEAWATPKTAETGGLEQLRRVVETESGSAAVLAAAMLAKQDAGSATKAKSLLARSIAGGPLRDRLLAIRRAPLDDEAITPALRTASTDSDVTIRVAALGRLTESPTDREAALAALASLAETGVLSAAVGLARAQDARGVEHLRKALTVPDPELRATTGKGLVEAGEYRSAAELLGDESPQVRAEIGCALLNALR